MIQAQAYLQLIRKIDRVIENKLVEVAQLRAAAYGTSSGGQTVKINGVPHEMERVQSSSNPHRIEDAVIRYLDMEQEINADIDLLTAVRRDVLSVIERLNTNEYDVVHKMYVGVIGKEGGRKQTKYLQIKEVAALLGKSESWVKDKHRSAKRNVQKMLDQRDPEQNEKWQELAARWAK